MASVASSPGASTTPQTRPARWVGGAIVSRGRRILYDKARSARKRTQSDIFCQHGLLAQLPARPPQSAVKCNLVRLNALSLGSGAFNPPIVAFSLSGDHIVQKKRKPADMRSDGFARKADFTMDEQTSLNKKISRQRPTLARASPALPSAMEPLTSVFGMGTGVTTPLWPPAKTE